MIISKSFEKVVSEKPLVVGAFLGEEVQINPALHGKIKDLIEDKNVSLEKGKVNKVFTFGQIPNKMVYLIGLGDRKKYDYELLEESIRDVNYKLGEELIIDLDSFIADLDASEVAKRFVRVVSYYNYVYDELLTEKIKNDLELKFYTKHNLEAEIEEAFNLGSAVANTRDLVNKPYNYLSAADLAVYAEELVKNLNNDKVTYKVYNKKEIETLEMYAFLGVNQGSDAEPRLIHLKYQGSNANPIALVGKGLMYDTGGYSLKSSMNTMKCDMAGAATVLGTFEAAVRNNLEVNLQVVICATDNRINGKALLPDDVLTAMNKKTIEIISTDAEGRLTLADAVCFAQKEGCKTVVDVATLTGACVVALGNYMTGLFGNNEEEINKMLLASKEANEGLWQLPINKNIREQVRDSKVADLKNSTGRGMGASGAAAFIEEFIEEDTKWLHLDIAGTAFRTSPSYKEFYGASGEIVNTLYNYLKKNI
ncbi:MAG: leucyl aminopeptidase [Bacilli bacterium]|nr:leucyl aminopeptidase [Bacilli bacterium]